MLHQQFDLCPLRFVTRSGSRKFATELDHRIRALGTQPWLIARGLLEGLSTVEADVRKEKALRILCLRKILVMLERHDECHLTGWVNGWPKASPLDRRVS